ncbi:radical SAM protein [candidate division KSB1 bacterium]|nr:radical SAM protein [candidate division KSB1 bacterium]
MLQSHYLYFLKHNLVTRVSGERTPLLVSYKITHRCNLTCLGCPFWRLQTPEPTLPQVETTLDTLRQDGVKLIIFEGGEPLLWRDGPYRLEDVIMRAKTRFFRVGITTNGTLPLESRADAIWVSLDGMAATHDANRGQTFHKIIKNIENSRHPHLLVNITINRLNYQEIPELVRFLKGKVRGITIQFYYPFPHTEDLWLPWAQRQEVLQQLIHLKAEGYPLLDSNDTLEALKQNSWRCHPWLIGSVEPDGRITYGCYLKNRAPIACEQCGFAAHVEISQAYDWHWPAIASGRRIFKFKII